MHHFSEVVPHPTQSLSSVCYSVLLQLLFWPLSCQGHLISMNCPLLFLRNLPIAPIVSNIWLGQMSQGYEHGSTDSIRVLSDQRRALPRGTQVGEVELIQGAQSHSPEDHIQQAEGRVIRRVPV